MARELFQDLKRLLNELHSKYKYECKSNNCDISIASDLIKELNLLGWEFNWKSVQELALACPDCGNKDFENVYRFIDKVNFSPNGDTRSLDNTNEEVDVFVCSKCKIRVELLEKDGKKVLQKVLHNKEEIRKHFEDRIQYIDNIIQDLTKKLLEKDKKIENTEKNMLSKEEIDKNAEKYKKERQYVESGVDHEPLTQDELNDLKVKELRKKEQSILRKEISEEKDEDVKAQKETKLNFLLNEDKKNIKEKSENKSVNSDRKSRMDRLIQNDGDDTKQKFYKKKNDNEDDPPREPIVI